MQYKFVLTGRNTAHPSSAGGYTYIPQTESKQSTPLCWLITPVSFDTTSKATGFKTPLMTPLPSWRNGLKQRKLHGIGTKKFSCTPVQSKYFILRRAVFRLWHLICPCTTKDLNTECRWTPFINLITMTMRHSPTARTELFRQWSVPISETKQSVQFYPRYITKIMQKRFKTICIRINIFKRKAVWPCFPCRFEE